MTLISPSDLIGHQDAVGKNVRTVLTMEHFSD